MEVAVRTRESRLDGGGNQNQGRNQRLAGSGNQNQGNQARERWQSEPGDQDRGCGNPEQRKLKSMGCGNPEPRKPAERKEAIRTRENNAGEWKFRARETRKQYRSVAIQR